MYENTTQGHATVGGAVGRTLAPRYARDPASGDPGPFRRCCGLPVIGAPRYLLNKSFPFLKTTSALKITTCWSQDGYLSAPTVPGLWSLRNVSILLPTVLSAFQGQNLPVSALPCRSYFGPRQMVGPGHLTRQREGPFQASCALCPSLELLMGTRLRPPHPTLPQVASSLTRMEPHPRHLQHNGRQPELAQSGHADPSPLSICSQGHEPFSVSSSSGVERWADSWPLGNQQIWTSPRHRRPRPGLAHGRPGTWQRQLTRGCPEDHAGKNAEGTPQFRQKERRDRSEASATGARARRGGPADVRRPPSAASSRLRLRASPAVPCAS